MTTDGKTQAQPAQTLMFREAAAAASVVKKQLGANAERAIVAGERLRTFAPRAVVTCARGSSDHAATYAKYLIETQLGLVTASAAPSVSSVYRAPQHLEGILYIVLSQSGKSPDLLANVKQAKASGALTLALVNVADSPLAEMADIVLPLHAGDELSVAATKSYIASLAAILQLVSEWSGKRELQEALLNLPDALNQAWNYEWISGVEAFEKVDNLFVIGRGLSFSVAQEAALKLKETCGLHAEAFSAAEVKHGPMALVKQNFRVLVITQNDGTQTGTEFLAEEFRQRGARVLVAGEGAEHPDRLAVVADSHPVIAPILAIQSFYRMANTLSIVRGYHPDQPPHLQKVTETV
jgi:glucosamine--fructose-6-phosphate aminotransferase (isomerizing)